MHAHSLRSIFAWSVIFRGIPVFLFYLPRLVLGVIRCSGKQLFGWFLFH